MHALCLERAGSFYLNEKKTELGETLIQKAWKTYEEWGASAVKELDYYFKKFDEITEKYGLEKINKNFECTYRGEIDTKHKGNVRMYFVEGPAG